MLVFQTVAHWMAADTCLVFSWIIMQHGAPPCRKAEGDNPHLLGVLTNHHWRKGQHRLPSYKPVPAYAKTKGSVVQNLLCV